jgi:hypothetical protein
MKGAGDKITGETFSYQLVSRKASSLKHMEMATHEWNSRFDRLLALFETHAANIRSLARVAEAHERPQDPDLAAET